MIKKLLIFLLLLTAAPLMVFSQEDEIDPRIIMSTSPDNPVAGSNWALTLLIAHHEPNEVNVFAPHFTGPLMLDQVIKGPRFVNPSTGQVSVNYPGSAIEAATAFERWTVMEYRFILNSPGTINFEAFTVVTPRGETKTAPFDLNVRRQQNTGETRNYRLVWEEVPANLKMGEHAIFGLRINGWNSTSLLPDAGFFMPPVPPGHILESIPLTSEEKSTGMVLKLRLIPLEANPLVLGGRRFSQDTSVFEIPSLRIPISPAEYNTAGNVEAMPEARPVPPFPSLETARQSHPDLYQKHRGEYEAVYAAALNLWETDSPAAALATLRQSERDHPAGKLFAVLRRGAEQNLGFTGTNDEKKGILAFFRGKSRAAVLKETPVRRVPDISGKEVARFREGQPVLLETQHEKWLRIITNDDNKISGWVPEDSIIFY